MANGRASVFGDCQPISIPAVAVASGFTYNVPRSETQLLLAVTFQLVTDANAANRRVVVNYRDSNNTTFAAIPAPFIQTATLTTVYTFALGASVGGDDGAANIGGALPYLPLKGGESVVVTITNVQAGDQASSIRLFVLQDHVRE